MLDTQLLLLGQVVNVEGGRVLDIRAESSIVWLSSKVLWARAIDGEVARSGPEKDDDTMLASNGSTLLRPNTKKLAAAVCVNTGTIMVMAAWSNNEST